VPDAQPLSTPRSQAKFVAAMVFTAALLALIFANGLTYMVGLWTSRPEYSHGFLLPVIAAFLLWQQQDSLRRENFTGSWLGLALVLAGLALLWMGELATLYVIVQYAFVAVVAGLALAFAGQTAFRLLWFAFLVLVLMVPLPDFLLETLSSKLQLLSSAIGVGLIRLAGISVFLEGNVIDLGTMKLQVVEACDGLRYLFPLMTLALVSVHFYRVAFWKRLLVFLSSIPITIVMNSLRIATIALLLEHGDRSLAEGFLHDFQGAAVFLLCAALLLLEMWLLARLGANPRPFREVFGFQLPASSLRDLVAAMPRAFPRPFVASVVLLIVAAVASIAMPRREAPALERTALSQFPLSFGSWRGHSSPLEPIYLEQLKLSDYFLGEFENDARQRIGVYLAFYASQRKGESAHSPRSCIPGGGWEITHLSRVALQDVRVNGEALHVNRAIIQLGDNKEIVYYWFQQRGRAIANEYLVKWYLFWDALTRNRSDGALVRLVAQVKPGTSVEQAERELAVFTRMLVPTLPRHIPD
jgi:exosortase D (VPLPA-CTERM-specific)